ncbi:MAG: glycosyltransferase family 2 protein, partial [Pseudomonadales bacterium]
TDDSAKIAESENVKVLPLCMNLGAWGAIQTGMRYAVKHGFQQVITMDADGQHHASEIQDLVKAGELDSNMDVIIGACPSRGSNLRRWAWGYFRRLTGVGIEDLTSGFRLYRRPAFEILSERKNTLLDYQDVGVLLVLQDAELSISEVAVTMSPRLSGKSHIYYSWLAVAYYMLSTTVLTLAKGKPLRIKNTFIGLN